MNASIKIKNLPPAPSPTRPYTSTEYQVCLDGYVLKKPTRIANVTNLQKAITPQSRIKSHESRDKGSKEKWAQMVKMARAGWSDQEIADAAGYTLAYTRKRLQLLRASGIDVPIEFARKEEKKKGARERSIELRKQGKTYEEIGAEVGLSYSTVRRYWMEEKRKWKKH